MMIYFLDNINRAIIKSAKTEKPQQSLLHCGFADFCTYVSKIQQFTSCLYRF